MSQFKPVLIKRAITVEDLPPMVPRKLAAQFGLVTPRTLKNHEFPKGPLHPIRRNSRSVAYRKEEILEFFGIIEPKPQPQPKRRRRAMGR
jgi:hypothetical protein